MFNINLLLLLYFIQIILYDTRALKEKLKQINKTRKCVYIRVSGNIENVTRTREI